MKEFSKIFYNAVVDMDLFYTIYEYITANYGEVVKKHSVNCYADLENAPVEKWKAIGNDAIKWLETENLPKVTVLYPNDNSPGKDTWGVLYYQTLSYMDRNHVGLFTFRHSNETEQLNMCHKCIENLKRLVNEIRETEDKDI